MSFFDWVVICVLFAIGGFVLFMWYFVIKNGLIDEYRTMLHSITNQMHLNHEVFVKKMYQIQSQHLKLYQNGVNSINNRILDIEDKKQYTDDAFTLMKEQINYLSSENIRLHNELSKTRHMLEKSRKKLNKKEVYEN